jgi:hypothetical protein
LSPRLPFVVRFFVDFDTDRSHQQNSNQPYSYTPKQLSSPPPRHEGGRWWLILGHLLAILRTSAVFSALRLPLIPANQIRWPPNPAYLCLVLPHMMPKKHPLVQNERKQRPFPCK